MVTLREKFETRQEMLATWITIPSQQTVEVIALSGLDFGVIDREHGPHSIGDLQVLAAAAGVRGMPVLARPRTISHSECQRILDTGVQGVQFAGITSHDMAVEALEMSFYPPIGYRGFSPFTRAGSFGGRFSADIVEQANRETAVVLNIESDMPHAEVTSIANLEGVSGIFIGIFDLSVSLGVAGNFSHPKLLDAVRSITDAASGCGKSVGTIVHAREEMDLFRTWGMNFFFLSVDTNVLREAYAQRVADFGAIEE